MRIALAKLLLQKPNCCCSTSPRTTGLRSRNWLEDYLAQYEYAFVLISHRPLLLDVTSGEDGGDMEQARPFLFRGTTTIPFAERGAADAAGVRVQEPARQIGSWRRSSTAFAHRRPKRSRCKAHKELEKIERIDIPPR